jgi:MOSC domain-containing protein YiiM
MCAETSKLDMKIISVNVGQPQEVPWNNGVISTSIFKVPVAGRVRVGRLDLDGDKQADLTVHGGPNKAVYAYPSEHYAYWQRELAANELPWGMFGENLTTSGLSESEVYVGDSYRAGTAELVVTQPRTPCYKLGIRFGDPEMIKRFLHSRRSGFYFSVSEEGEVEAGDSLMLVGRQRNTISIADLNRLYPAEAGERELLERAVRVEALPENWRRYFREQLANMSS